MAKTSEFKLPAPGTDLSYTPSTRLLESSTGNDVTLPLFTPTDAGLVPSGGVSDKVLHGDGTWGYASLRYLTESLSSVAPNNTRHTAVFTSKSGAETNVDLFLSVKGSASFGLGPAPDGTSTAGNKRGVGAVDLQTSRLTAAQVASGTNSFVAGSASTASGTYSTALGRTSMASGGNSFAVGQGNTASGTSTFAVGDGNTASGLEAGALGADNTASNTNSYALGNDNSVTGATSTAVGDNNTCSGTRSFAFGSFNEASGAGAVAYGVRAKAQYPGQHAWASGGSDDSISGTGRIQKSAYYPNTTTTDATPTEMLIVAKGGTNRAYVPSNVSALFEVRVLGVSTSGTKHGAWVKRGIIRNSSGTTALVGTVHTSGNDLGSNADAPPAGWDVEITADNTNDALKVTVTGEAGVTVEWGAEIEFLEVYRA